MTAEERKAAIVEAAVRLFSEKGFRGTTTRELAAAVGVTEPILYQHFATKRDLYTAIIEHGFQSSQNAGDEQLEAARVREDDWEFFTRLGELVLAWYQEQPEMVRLLLFSALEGHEYAEVFFQSKILIYYQILTEYLERRMKKKAFRTMDPVWAARAFTGMLAHSGMAMSVFQCGTANVSRKQIVEDFVRIFLDGMKQRRSKTA